MSSLSSLYDEYGLSPWVDNLQRSWLRDNTLRQLIDQGVRGLTSNPTIFAKAISEGSEYDQEIAGLQGASVDDAYWELVFADIKEACRLMAPLHQATDGRDGFVSMEVDPRLARDTGKTIASAKAIAERMTQPNLMVKIPATREGIPAIREAIASGISINVTLIFSLHRYQEVMEAYITGLEDLSRSSPERLGAVHSVASFFISRTDTKIDAALDKLQAPESLKGKTAVAQAKIAYQAFLEKFSSERWLELASQGANIQRPLWASTSTKNPAYPDLLYVESLIGPQCVNTMPYATLLAYVDHGRPSTSLLERISDSEEILAKVTDLGINLDAVAIELEEEGVASFAESHEGLLELLSSRLHQS